MRPDQDREGDHVVARPPTRVEQEIEALYLYAWVGEDELGSGEVGVKQGMTPAGCIPLVSVSQEKLEGLRRAMAVQGAYYGKKIRLVRFKFDGVIEDVGAADAE
jgi:hypothetical protein